MNDAARAAGKRFHGIAIREFKEMIDGSVVFLDGRRMDKTDLVEELLAMGREAGREEAPLDDLFLKETTHGGWKPRAGSIYWYPLSAIEEITVYPALWGQARLVYGRRDDDTWLVGYDYPDVKSALEAAEEWDGRSDPGHGWIRRLDPSDRQIDPREEL